MRLARLLYNHNPFYVISAGCVLFGLDRLCGGAETGAYRLSLALYIVLLALSAWGIVRRGRVWEDVRTILLLVVLLCLALSTSFDRELITDPRTGIGFLLGAWIFTTVLLEGLAFLLGMRLPAAYRLPLHGLLACFFLAPIALAALARAADSSTVFPLARAVAAFPTLCAGFLLALLPALRRGGSDLLDSGTPWRWPAYPLPLFVVIVVAVIGRSHYLTLSFHPAPDGGELFHPLFLLPLVGVLTLLLVEIGSRRPGSPYRMIGWCLPVMLLGWSGFWYPPADLTSEIIDEVAALLAPPRTLAAGGLLLIALYAELRRLREAEAVALAIILLITFFDPDREALRPEPLLTPTLGFIAYKGLRCLITRRASDLVWSAGALGALITAAEIRLLGEIVVLLRGLRWPRGLGVLLGGVLSLAVALGISLRKGRRAPPEAGVARQPGPPS